MTARRSLAAVLVAGAVLVGCGSTRAADGALFAYDPRHPLDVRATRSATTNGVTTVELTYASPKGGRVPATLVLPESSGRHPAVIFQHGAGGASRDDFRAEAEELARAGVASLLVDAPFNRPPYRPWTTFTLRDRDQYVQNVVDLRRGIDVLESRADVDAGRVAVVGHSYGGVLAGIVAAVDERVDGVVVMASPGRITDYLRREGQKWIRSGRPAKQRAARKRQLARYLAHMKAVDGAAHIGRVVAAPVFFQFGRDDPMPRAWFDEYTRAAPPTARVEWYDAGHGLCDCATRDRKEWLLERLTASGAGADVIRRASTWPPPSARFCARGATSVILGGGSVDGNASSAPPRGSGRSVRGVMT